MRSLQAKMFLVFALIATLPLMALSYLALSEARTALTEEVGRAHADTARAAAAYVGSYLETGRLVAAADARNEDLLVAARANDTAGMAASLRAAHARGTTGGAPLFERLVLLDARGHVVAAWPQGSEPFLADRSETEAFLAGRGQGGALLLRPRADAPVVPIAAPVRSGDENLFLGVLVADLDLDPLGTSLQAFAFGPSEGVLLTDAQGRLLTHPDPAAAPLDWSEVEPVRRALAGAPGYMEFDEPVRGTRVLAGYAPVRGLGWAVVELVPAADAYAGLARLTGVLIVLSGILLGAVLLASVVLARRIVRPVQELTKAAGAFAQGRLRTRIEPRGTDEIAELAHTFNTMADRVGESLEGLRRSESRYRNLVESANDAILTLEPGGEVSFAGPQAERLLGWSAGALVGERLEAIVHEADLDRVRAAVQHVVTRGEPVLQLAHLVRPRAGGAHLVRSNLSPIFGPDGLVARVLLVATDITTERRQELVREQAFLMARLVSEEASLDRLAREGLAIALRATGGTRGAVLTPSAEGLREAATVGGRMGHEAASRAMTERRRVVDGRLFAVPLLERGEALGALLVEVPEPGEDDGEVLEALASQLAVGLRRSLFEQRLREYASELEARVAARTAELQAKNEEIESFLYSVSHDLKAPLISIEGYAEGLEEDYAGVLDEHGRAYLDRIRKNASLMEKLILDLLELSRIGRARSEPEDVDTTRLAEEVASRLEDRFEAHGGEIRIEAPLPAVRGERNRIEQLLGNLMENAVKYRDPARPPRLVVRGEAMPEGAHLVLEDNGRGIPGSQREQLFRIFQRLPAPRGMPDPGGTGMGLAIVKRIVDTHGGRVWVESETGRGTAFHVVLPLAAGRGAQR